MFELFKTFFQIGLFTIGGGYAMIPLIEQKVVDEKAWVSREELLDLIAVAQSCPGIFAVNISLHRTEAAGRPWRSGQRHWHLSAFLRLHPGDCVCLPAVPRERLGGTLLSGHPSGCRGPHPAAGLPYGEECKDNPLQRLDSHRQRFPHLEARRQSHLHRAGRRHSWLCLWAVPEE